MGFIYHRTVRFQETDAAGVVYFANVLALCHEAYEASLERAGFELKTFFGRSPIAVPIVHARVDFLQPMFCGDRLQVHLVPQLRQESEFEVTYHIYADEERLLGRAMTRHVCVEGEVRSRQRVSLPANLRQWVEHLSGSG